MKARVMRALETRRKII